MVGTGRFELPTPRTPSECSTRLSHVPTERNPLRRAAADGVDLGILHYGSSFVGSARKNAADLLFLSDVGATFVSALPGAAVLPPPRRIEFSFLPGRYDLPARVSSDLSRKSYGSAGL